MARSLRDKSRYKDKESALRNSDLHFLRSEKAEEDFQKLYRFSETLINAIPYGIGVVAEDGDILYLSQQLAALFKENAIGKKCWDMYRDDKRQCSYCPLRKGIDIGETRTTESSGVFGGGTFEITHTGMMFDGKKAVLEVYHDITEKRKNQEIIGALTRNLAVEKRKLEKVLSVDVRMRSIRELNDLVDFIVEKSTEILEAKRCSLMLLDTGANELSIRGAKGLDDRIIAESRVEVGKSIAGMVAGESCPILVKNIEANVRFSRKNRPSYETKSFISAPIKVHNKVIGVVNLADKQSSDGRIFNETDLNILCTIVHLASIAIENADFVRQLTYLSVTDSLTGLYNHRYFVTHLDREIHRSKRYGKPVCLFMIDLDDFKSYNDAYGHLEGDHLLKTFSKTLKDNLRVVDIICRYAGDEFVVILPETDVSEAEFVAEKVKRAVERATLRKKVTISVGIAKCNNPHMNKYDLILKADTALFEAKKQGKNQVHSLE